MSHILSRRRLLAAVLLSAGAQTMVIASMISSNQAVLSEGTPVLAQAFPVDPRDLLRGDFVSLAYEFSALPQALVEGEWPKEAGSVRLWVRLRPAGDGIWHATAAAFAPMPAQEGSAVLQSEPFDYVPSSIKPATVRIRYGIERYYVPEGQGKVLEAARDTNKLLVELRVLPDGTVRIDTARIQP